MGRVRDEPFCGKNFLQIKMLLDAFFYHLEIKKYTVKKAISATNNEIIAVWKKVAQDTTPGCTRSVQKVSDLRE